MRRDRSRWAGGLVLIVAVMLLLLPRSAPAADISMVQTGCQIVSVDPPLFRVEFSARSTNPDVMGCMFYLIPLPWDQAGSDVTRILECFSPPEWAGMPRPEYYGCGAWATSTPYPSSCIEGGETIGPFAFTVHNVTAGYETFFENAVFESFARDTLCVDCSDAVPTSGATWGKVKGRYR